MKLLVLDKDGTLTRTKSGHTFVQHPEDQVLIDGVAEAIAAYAADGWTMAIASNQGGVAAGFKTLEQAIAEMRYALSLLPIKIQEAMFCPDNGETCYSVTPAIRHEYVPNRPHDEITAVGRVHSYPDSKRRELNGTYRKPNSGMLKAIEGDHIVYKKKLMIGYRDKDFGAAVNAGFGYMHVSVWLEPFIK